MLRAHWRERQAGPFSSPPTIRIPGPAQRRPALAAGLVTGPLHQGVRKTWYSAARSSGPLPASGSTSTSFSGSFRIEQPVVGIVYLYGEGLARRWTSGRWSGKAIAWTRIGRGFPRLKSSSTRIRLAGSCDVMAAIPAMRRSVRCFGGCGRKTWTLIYAETTDCDTLSVFIRGLL